MKKTTRETGHFFFSFRATPRCPTCRDRSHPYTATRTEAARLVTVTSLRLFSARCLGCTHSFFSLEYSAAAEVRMLKANGIKELYPHVFFNNCHTSTVHHHQRKTFTKQRALVKPRASRNRHVYSPIRSRYISLGWVAQYS